MKTYPHFRVVFVLAYLLAQVGTAGPLAVSIRIPESLHQRPVWHVARLAEGELALGFEGGLALGRPGGPWRLISAPSGQTVRVVAAGHGRLLVAGTGFCGFVAGSGVGAVPGMQGEYQCAEAVAEGWLVAGREGVWRVTPAGVGELVARPGPAYAGFDSRLCRIRDEMVVSLPGEVPRLWRHGRLSGDASLAGFGKSQVYFADAELVVSTKGIVDHQGRKVLAESARDAMLKRGGIVGVAQFGSVVLVATFAGGINAYDRDTGTELWSWRAAGEVYSLVRDGDHLLLGTATGVYALVNPALVRHWRLNNVVPFELIPGVDSSATLITAAGAFHVGEDELSMGAETWPEQGGANVRDGMLRFGEASTELRTRFVTGLARVSDRVAVSLSQELILLSRRGEKVATPLDGVVGAVATDGRNFLAATTTRGVHVVAPDGKPVDRIGDGRASVSELRPGKLALLFWDGSILDSDSLPLGRVPIGNPRDAALMQGRLAVLVTRPDRDPLIGWLTKDGWQPLEIPGLAEVGAEQIAATASHLFVAGPRGVLRVRLPLAPSVPPRVGWRWSAPVTGSEVMLPDSAHEAVRVALAAAELPPAPATSVRMRAGRGAWTDAAPDNSLSFSVAAGATPVVLQAERNGLLSESIFTVVRPRPWWQRTWAWPLHGLVLGLVVIGLVRWRTRRLEHRTRELETRVAARTTELRQANAVKEEFLASISHEIRNPLNGVVGICEMLAEREVGPRERMLVRTLGGCADQLRSMLDDILEFSQLERKAPVLSNADFELISLVEECARVMDPDLTSCSLLLPETTCWLHGDSGKVRQVVCNLISNALKYGVPREAGVEAQITPADGGRIRVRLAVRNTGPTIPPAEIPLLFESFRRGRHTAGEAGSGLGLAVCRRLAVAMGGHLTAASQEGVTEFAFEVVLPSAQPPAPVQAAPATVSRVLAIEDEDYNRLVLGHVLRALGYSVDWAENAAAALRLAAAHSYDLILTDWRLPDMEGGELCKRLLAVVSLPKPPVIAVTAYANAEKLAEAKAAGMSGFVTKPVTREKLERAIRGLSTSRQPRRSLDTETNALPGGKSPLASLGPLAPSPLRLAADLAEKWRSVAALAEMQDPRTGREAHGLRSLLLLAGEESAAEQVGLIETAADSADWAAVQRLAPFAAEEVVASEHRLRA